MADHEDVRIWILKAIQLLVDSPDDVVVEAIRKDQLTTFRIKTSPKDVGKIIGKQGRTSRSMRILVSGMAKTLHCQFNIDIEEAGKVL